MQTSNISWSKWSHIHPLVVQSLLENKFEHPTDVQSYCLSTFQNYNDFIIASKTGSGKTLSFGIPILSQILFEKQGSENRENNYLRALFIAPTRELALQIEKHMNQINEKTKKLVSIISLVGGISKDKQKRLLGYKPDIIICTPGRFWDFAEEEQHPYLQDLNKVEYFVMDEADRMIELGHFDDLDKIINKMFNITEKTHDKEIIQQLTKNSDPTLMIKQPKDKKADLQKQLMEGGFIELEEEEFKKNGANMLQKYELEEVNMNEKGEIIDQEGLEVEELDEEIEEGEENSQEEEDGEEEEEEDDDENSENEEENSENADEEELEEEEQNEEIKEGQEELDDLMNNQVSKKKNTKRKVFLVSATILQQFKGKQKFKITSKELKKNKDKQKKNDLDPNSEKQDAFNIKIQALLQKVKFTGKPKIIDLTSKTLFPEKLKEYKSVVEEDDKILYLYHFIQQNIDQNFIVFCNSISYAKKVTHLLETLKLTATILHSELQQRQRLKKLDQFKSKKSNILVCTDVAARGLDIPLVQNVVHYQVPMDIDTYVHRAGRTARIGQEGTSYVFIGPQDAKRYNQLCKQLGKEEGLQGLDMTMKQKNKLQELVKEAIDYEKKKYQLQKKQQETVWYKKISKAADIELDEELLKELDGIQEEVSKKRVIQQNQKQKYNDVQKDVKNIDRSRRNALFLDASQIQEFNEKIQKIKQNNLENKNRKSTNPGSHITFRNKKKLQKVGRKQKTKNIFGQND